MVRAFITGVTGQDGWYLAQLLHDAGDDVSGLIRPGETAPPGVHSYSGDLADTASIVAAIDAAQPDEIYNLAGVSSVAESWRRPELTADITGLGFLRILTAVQQCGDARSRDIRIVQASSAEIFGNAAPPQNESTAIAPSTPYGAAKAFAQHLVSLYRATGMSVSSAVLFNHESPRRPDTFVTRRITSAVAKIAHGSTDPLRLGNLDSRRDWGFAGDYARAMMLIARHPYPDDFVIATGTSHSVADFVAAAFAHVGISDWRSWVEIDSSAFRPSDSTEQRGDSTKARTELGWEPTLTFDELVQLMVDEDLHSDGQK